MRPDGSTSVPTAKIDVVIDLQGEIPAGYRYSEVVALAIGIRRGLSGRPLRGNAGMARSGVKIYQQCVIRFAQTGHRGVAILVVRRSAFVGCIQIL